MYVPPEILAFATVDCFTQLEGEVDKPGDLYGVWFLETFLDVDGVGDAPDCRRKDDPSLHVTWAK